MLHGEIDEKKPGTPTWNNLVTLFLEDGSDRTLEIVRRLRDPFVRVVQHAGLGEDQYSFSVLTVNEGVTQIGVPYACQKIAFLAFFAGLAEPGISNLLIRRGVLLFESHQVHQTFQELPQQYRAKM
jgi:hypothetical protein